LYSIELTRRMIYYFERKYKWLLFICNQ